MIDMFGVHDAPPVLLAWMGGAARCYRQPDVAMIVGAGKSVKCMPEPASGASRCWEAGFQGFGHTSQAKHI